MIKAAERIVWAVDGSWLDNEGLWLSYRNVNGSVQRLKQLMFAWHEGSWYGAEIEEKNVQGMNGLLLPPLLAVDYLAMPVHARLMKVQWSSRMALYIEAASLLHRALLEGWYAPSPAGWTGGGSRWSLHLPEAEHEAYERWRHAAAAEGLKPGLADEWLSLAADQAIESSREARLAWSFLSARMDRSKGDSLIRDKEDWWSRIGWKQDHTPFRIALRLAEPQEDRSWKFQLLLQSRQEEALSVALAYNGEQWLPVETEGQSLPEHWKPLLQERLNKELHRWIEAYPPLASGKGSLLKQSLTDQEAWLFLEEGSVRLLEAGSSLLLPAWWEAVRIRKPRLKANIKSSVGSMSDPVFGLNAIVDFDWKIAVGNLDLTEEEFLRLADEKRRLVQIRSEWVYLNHDDIEQIRRWMKTKGEKKSLSLSEMLELHLRGGWPDRYLDEELIGAGIEAEVELNAHLERWLTQLRQTSELPLIDKPASFHGELRPYQLQGLSWLVFLRRFGLGGCLADDMGLGKTIQFTAYMLHIKEEAASRPGTAWTGPSLLICPTSVIGNWEKELERFAPALRVFVHYGPRRLKGDEFREAASDADLVITSYALAPLDNEELSSIKWNALCLDEAQNIKNVYTKQSGAIRQIPSCHRIAMTGTPMENRLTELWSIHDFMNPGYLGSLAEFRREVVQPIERTKDEELINRLQRWVQPFMLRRLKKDPAIALALPDKHEAKTYISLTVEQGTLYENTVSGLLEKLNTLTPMQRRGLILATLTRLKQLCDHPSLLLRDHKGSAAKWEAERSNKVTRLLEMVEEIAARQERCLIFTQFVDMGSMLQAELEKLLGLRVPFLHGGVSKAERDAMIADYQNPEQERCAFILSLKAGGTGLNLTAANHVFHFDRWWNPAVENQATDRAFRIGQQKEVQVHKFVTLGTLEEKIDDMIARKQAMNEQVVNSSESWITELSHEELRELFTLRKTWLSG
ncbi:DEAD/DEAH box helicase [Paenibacillus sp. MAHUQ-46]|uniref:DEAD/DEAH box helicase n=2 Tax=Paenibacillus TaxID=44249 RepID=A0A934J5S4_9BACL|nr:DEAD/DEAH box helicase [Paenibacillus roseus]MBJ6363794.1 DEAD/DEAH box helicase [Paenibacillus roseus]